MAPRGPWGQSSLNERVIWCREFARAVASHQDRLCELTQAEVHKPRWQALTADVMSLLACARWHERHAKRVLAPKRVRGRPWWMLGQSHRCVRVPLGTVGIIATWNYPVQLLGIQLVQALMAGNDVIVKPSERAPRTQRLLLELASRGLPAGTLTALEPTREAGPELLRHRPLDHVVFTGSTRVGRQVASWAGENLVPTSLELSGCDSAIVLADADPKLAATTLWHTMAMNAGQTCMAPRRVLVERGAYRPFLSALSLIAAGAQPLRLIDEAAAARVSGLVEGAVRAGGRVLTGVFEPAEGAVFRPTVVADCPRHAELVRGDHFGPALAVVPVQDVEDALRVHLACPQHLACSIFTGDPDRAAALAPRLRAGFVTINDCVLPVSHPGAGLGGVGESGWGVTRGEEGLLAMTRPVYVSITSTRVRTPAGEPSPSVLAKLAWFSRRVLGGVKREAPLIGPASASELSMSPNPSSPSVASSSPPGATTSEPASR
jgi:aldehyde dehydrogenase (NAD+)